jgi:hypothetical protein
MKLHTYSWLQPFSAKYYAIEQHVFAFSFIIEGTVEKVLLFHLRQFSTKTLVSLNKNCIFEHYSEVQTIKNLLIDIDLVVKIYF